MTVKYRPEIDGLRTIAVLSVIIYHAEFPWGEGHLLAGGFLGVDIFFVISGYLITALLINEYNQNAAISIPRFYERRARRLLPALLVVMLASLPFAWLYLAPVQLVDFAKSLVSSVFFASNFYWHTSMQQYGAESALLKPFLHTWSLAVEEQYYIVFPLLLLAIQRKFEHRRTLLLSAGLLASIAFAEWSSSRDVSAAFYMLPSRFWELLSGGLLASLAHRRAIAAAPGVLVRMMPGLGLGLILYSIVGTEFSDGHPGIVTIPSIAGTALIIWFASPGEWVTRLLSSRLFVAIGLISYSLYLWHYPVFAFGRILSFVPTNNDKVVWIVLTFVLSIATFFLIEKPFRQPAVVSRKPFFLALLVPLLAIVILSASWIASDGSPSRLGYLREVLESATAERLMIDGAHCHSGGKVSPLLDLEESCDFEMQPGAPYLVLLGDSHAGVLAASTRQLAEKNGLNFLQITHGGCLHISGLKEGLCEKRSAGLKSYLDQYDVAALIYSARLPLALEIERFDNQEGGREDQYKRIDRETIEQSRRSASGRIEQTLTEWSQRGYPLVLVYPVPEQGFHIYRRLFFTRPLIMNAQQLPDLSTSYPVFQERVSSSYQLLDRVQGNTVRRVYPEHLFCSVESQRCFASQGVDLYFGTDNHVSPLGADMIMREVAQSLELQIPDDFRATRAQVGSGN